MDIDNRRDFFRVDVFLPARWRILNHDECALIKNGACNILPTKGSLKISGQEATVKAPAPGDDQLNKSIQSLNSKLDFVINMIMNAPDALSAGDRVIEISASGLKFLSSEKVDAGVFVKIDLLIPGVTYSQVELIAEILRVDKNGNDFVHAANIAFIDEDARELIVKMVFQKQRIDIRRGKNSQEDREYD